MKSRDSQFFNCSEEHELKFVADKFEKPEEVKTKIKEWCKDGTIKYEKHEALYEKLKKAGFKMK